MLVGTKKKILWAALLLLSLYIKDAFAAEGKQLPLPAQKKLRQFQSSQFLDRTAKKEATATAIEPRQMGNEPRFKTWTFYDNAVYKYVGYYLHPTYIEFEAGETVSTISSPKPSSWQIVPNGHRLFLKPVEDDADTTATVITNKRIYFFELHAKEAKSPFSSELTFFIKFKYPEEKSEGDNNIIRFAGSSLPDLSDPERFNFNYTMAGEESIAPIKVFDDAEFTYFQFRDKNARLPAIFAVDNQNYESIVNYRVVGDFLIVEQVNHKFTLRNGSDVLCVFNENLLKVKK